MEPYATALADAIERVLPDWVVRSVARYTDDPAVLARASDAGVEARAEVGPAVRALLEADIDDQRSTPLALLRSAVRYPTAVLREAGVPEVARDEFAVRAFPDDVYDLAPASFADVDPSLQEPGLEWGAAKAHTHLTRRRSRRVVAYAPDLMDQSRIRAAGLEVAFVGSAAALAGAEADVFVVDLGRPGVLEAVPQLQGRVIGFGSHVDRDLLAAARAAGCEQVLARSAFFGDVARWLG